MRRLILFGTDGCHLCDLAEQAVRQWIAQWPTPVALDQADISDNEDWMHRYAVRIPVLRDQLTGLELDWPFGPEQLDSFLAPHH